MARTRQTRTSSIRRLMRQRERLFKPPSNKLEVDRARTRSEYVEAEWWETANTASTSSSSSQLPTVPLPELEGTVREELAEADVDERPPLHTLMQFWTACTQPGVCETIDPDDIFGKKRKQDDDDASEEQEQEEEHDEEAEAKWQEEADDVEQGRYFITRLFDAYLETESRGLLTENLWRPYQAHLRSLVHRMELSTHDTLSKFQDFGATIPFLSYLLYVSTINTRQHVAYVWLTSLLTHPDRATFINRLDSDKETPITNWSKDQLVRNALVFHELVRAGADVELCDAEGKNFVQIIIDSDVEVDRLESLMQHGYAHLCCDALFRPHPKRLSVWSIDTEIDSAAASEDATPPATSLTPQQRRLTHLVLDRWTNDIRPAIHSSLVDASLISDCASICIQYLDGSNYPTPHSSSGLISESHLSGGSSSSAPASNKKRSQETSETQATAMSDRDGDQEKCESQQGNEKKQKQ